MTTTDATAADVTTLYDRPLADWADAIAARIADEGASLVDDVLATAPDADDPCARCLRRLLTESLGYAPGAGGCFLQTARAHLATQGQEAENAARLAAYLKERPDLIAPLVGTPVIECDYFDPCE
jgi:hypothetical protein